MTDMGETFLPTHVEAMRKAVREAERGNAQMANAWVRIAAELREGSVPPAEESPFGPPERPVSLAGMTQVIPKVVETGHRVDCINCGLGIYWSLTADGPEGHPIWLHNITHQHLCPRDEGYKGPHTFAAPSGE